MKNYSKSEILKFLYGELSPDAEKDFIEALYSNEELFQEFESLQEARAELDSVEIKFQPSENTVKAVMDHVKAGPARKRRHLIGIFTGEKIPGFKVFAIASMVIACAVTAGLSYSAFRKSNHAQPSDPAKVLSWEAPAIHERISRVRYNLGNMSGQREVPMLLGNNTYQLVNTTDYANKPANVVLVNLK